MRSIFPSPARITEVRFLDSASRMRQALAKAGAWILLDQGAAPAFELEGRGLFTLKGGEGCKSWRELERVLAWLAEGRAERSQPLVVIGGGAALDLGALAASLYKRGMPLVLVPSTLLGMVDATLGGKTAVDLLVDGRLQKNLLGTFYPAKEVWVHAPFLATLPERERLSGAGEVYKTLWIQGGRWEREALVRYVRAGKLSPQLRGLVKDCLNLKAGVVKRDPLDENRVREVLNFGHTAGHALESASGLSHGECVLWGMAIESSLLRSKAMQKETVSALRALGLELPAALKEGRDWEKFLGADKKIRGGKLEMSLLAAPGRAVKKKYSLAQVAEALRAFPESFRRAGAYPPA